jgi:hypothetical protein
LTNDILNNIRSDTSMTILKKIIHDNTAAAKRAKK